MSCTGTDNWPEIYPGSIKGEICSKKQIDDKKQSYLVLPWTSVSVIFSGLLSLDLPDKTSSLLMAAP